MAEIKDEGMKSCEGCYRFSPLGDDWWFGDCRRGYINGIPVLERVHNAHLEHGDCKPERIMFVSEESHRADCSRVVAT